MIIVIYNLFVCLFFSSSSCCDGMTDDTSNDDGDTDSDDDWFHMFGVDYSENGTVNIYEFSWWWQKAMCE